MTSHEKNYENALILADRTILDAIKLIDNASLQIALVVDDQRRLLGTVTDGDVRRGILSGVKLEDPVTKIMNNAPTTVLEGTASSDILQIMTSRKIHQLPVVDAENHLVGLEWLDAQLEKSLLPAVQQEDVWVVLMLGGQGTRLHPLTQTLPKPMIPVGDKPLLETIIRNFSQQGFKRFFFSVNFMADMIVEHFGDGSRFGVQISYLTETTPLGTAGALSLLPERPSGPLIVMNGDILTNSNFMHLIDFHRQNKAQATMCVREHQQQVPYGIVQNTGTKLTSIVEKPMQTYFVNAGIYVLDPAALDLVPQGQYFDMPQLFDVMAKQGLESAVFPIREYWLDIGRFTDLDQARADYNKVFGCA